MSKIDFEIIDEADVEFVRRGRKSSVSPELVEMLKKLPKGKTAKITSMAGNPKNEKEYTTHKARISATLRSAGKQAGKKVKITWTPSGVPQVSAS
jgi:hypothetical protein